jgi:hypothetical protein
MKLRIYHPWWTHMPALALLGVIVASFVVWAPHPLPDRIPTHFGLHGQPNGFGPPWLFCLGFFLAPMFMLTLSAVLDELWVRQELDKGFNWLSLFDEAIIGFGVGLNLGWLDVVRGDADRLHVHGGVSAVCALVSVGLAALLERRRPFRAVRRSREEAAIVPDAELVEHIRAGRRWVHWERQNPE